MMSKHRYTCLSWLPALFLLTLILVLLGCSSEVAGTSPTVTATSSTPKLDSSPKGPGAANLTATARATSVSTTCPTITAAPASTTGWKIYKDAHFPFLFSFPPDWRAGSFTDDSGNDYIVQVFPPGSTTPIGQAGLADQEHFAIAIALSGPTGTYANDPNWRAEASTITISGTRTIIYDRTTRDCGEVNRGATDDFGHHHFTFFMSSIPPKAQNDIALFLGVLQSFIYGG